MLSGSQHGLFANIVLRDEKIEFMRCPASLKKRAG